MVIPDNKILFVILLKASNLWLKKYVNYFFFMLSSIVYYYIIKKLNCLWIIFSLKNFKSFKVVTFNIDLQTF